MRKLTDCGNGDWNWINGFLWISQKDIQPYFFFARGDIDNFEVSSQRDASRSAPVPGRSGIALLIVAALCVAPAGDSETLERCGSSWSDFIQWADADAASVREISTGGWTDTQNWHGSGVGKCPFLEIFKHYIILYPRFSWVMWNIGTSIPSPVAWRENGQNTPVDGPIWYQFWGLDHEVKHETTANLITRKPHYPSDNMHIVWSYLTHFTLW